MGNNTLKEYYNSIPVHYCKNCLSLSIITDLDSDEDSCLNCGNMEIDVSSIEEWILNYTKMHGHPYLELNGK